MRDEALEGWFLAATRPVSEQLETDLLLHGERLGVPVVVIDCKLDDQIWSLTALCTHSPEIVETLATLEAGNIVRGLKAEAELKLEQLTRDSRAGSWDTSDFVLSRTTRSSASGGCRPPQWRDLGKMLRGEAGLTGFGGKG